MVRGSLDEIIDIFNKRDIKGELVIVLEGLSPERIGYIALKI